MTSQQDAYELLFEHVLKTGDTLGLPSLSDSELKGLQARVTSIKNDDYYLTIRSKGTHNYVERRSPKNKKLALLSSRAKWTAVTMLIISIVLYEPSYLYSLPGIIWPTIHRTIVDVADGDNKIAFENMPVMFLMYWVGNKVLDYLMSKIVENAHDFVVSSITPDCLKRNQWVDDPFEDHLNVLLVSFESFDNYKIAKPLQLPAMNTIPFGGLSLSKVYYVPGALEGIKKVASQTRRSKLGPILNFGDGNFKTMVPIVGKITEPFQVGQIMATAGLPVHNQVFYLSLVALAPPYNDKLRAILISEEAIIKLHSMLFKREFAEFARGDRPSADNAAIPEDHPSDKLFKKFMWHATLNMARLHELHFHKRQLHKVNIQIPLGWLGPDARVTSTADASDVPGRLDAQLMRSQSVL